ncbi:hypothetical protein DSO57_1024723 [Entomophthora muscae]|uniref:Uncharacterized protein n=1 Tax=Entomophthora muscae TaxID=34485 RepID=A0ACC2TDK4_9FUNG|nr:hypothetical protein DSO57_1024723 [Entomophthora muscae]
MCVGFYLLQRLFPFYREETLLALSRKSRPFVTKVPCRAILDVELKSGTLHSQCGLSQVLYD